MSYAECSEKRWEMKILGKRFGNLNNSTYLCRRKFKTTTIMEASTTKVSAAAQLLVSISDLSMLNDIKKAISMLKGVTAVKKQKQKEYDITKTKAFKEALDDVKHGRVTHYDSVDDMFKSVLGEEAFSKIRSQHV
jgi:collagenase-like PrtC family protease